jgi:hypothetical protein
MISVWISLNLNLTRNEEELIFFQPFNEDQGLPFPLNLSFFTKSIFIILHLAALILGLRFRKVIFAFMNSSESNLGPINVLIWLDQVTGMIMGFLITLRIFTLAFDEPLISILGENFCKMTNLIGGLYVGGGYIWTCYIALFRLAFVVGQKFLKSNIEIETLLHLMISAGTVQV